MFATRRLWRRAPAWRLCLVTALAATGLAAMFPPATPAWVQAWRDRASHAVQPAASLPGSTPSASATRFDPLAVDAASDPQGAMQMPAPGVGRSGVIAFAGHHIPLPTGQWQVLVLARDNAPVPIQAELLGRIEDGQATGLLLAESPNPINGAAQPLTRLSGCFAANSIADGITQPPRGVNPAVHECWTVAPFDLTASAPRNEPDDLLTRGLAQLQRFGAQPPGHTLALRYLRSDDAGWMTMLLLLPDHRAAAPTAERRLLAWVRRFVADLHDGYSNKDIRPLERDPG